MNWYLMMEQRRMEKLQLKSRVKKVFKYLFFLFSTANSFGQNYVSNYSFELVDTIPPINNYIIDWKVYQTVDFYSEDPFIAGWPSPCNNIGCQNSKSGISHIGLYNNAFSTSNYREYVQTQLIQPLVSGQSYCVSFYISRSDTMEYASKDWGILFTDTVIAPPDNFSNYLIDAPAQVTVPYFVVDDDNWTLIQQIYTPNSPNEYLTIGNFLNDASFPQQFVQSSCSGCKQSYYYIDDVSVSLIRQPVLANDTVIYIGENIIIGDTAQDMAEYSWSPTTSLSNPTNWQTIASPNTTTTYTLTKITVCDTTEAKVKIEVKAKENNLTVYPNPNNGVFQINYSLVEDAFLVIYDALGRKVYRTRLTAGSNILFTPEINLASAMYFLALENEDERLFQTKMVVGE